MSVNDGCVRLEVDRSVYPLDAIYAAAYVFTDRCFVLLDVAGPEKIRVELRARSSAAAAELVELGGSFGNELLVQAWRQRVTEHNQAFLQSVTARAMGGAMGPAGLDDLDFGTDADAFDDPLGIAVPWEEKYGKGGPDAEPKSSEGEGG